MSKNSATDPTGLSQPDCRCAFSCSAPTPSVGALSAVAEAIYEYVTRGDMVCSLGVSNLYVLAGVLLLTLLLRRAFCGYICPIGTISDWIRATAHRLGWKPIRVPPLARSLARLVSSTWS